MAIAVMTDGEDSFSIIRDVIVDATTRMKHPREIKITFLTISSRSFGSPTLKALDDKLLDVGAAYDIVDTRSFAELEKYGLTTDKVWYESFDGLDTITENYIRNMRANGEQINKNPRIIMSTIHGAKGGEADNVLLMQDLTNAALETMSHDPDELHRLFYTGATRAKRELHVLDPKNFDRAYIL